MPPTELPVDNYQGEESDLVIGSFVKSNDGGQMGFVGDANRLNVAISRARCVVDHHQVSRSSINRSAEAVRGDEEGGSVVGVTYRLGSLYVFNVQYK